jgi:hypothetical protein
MGCKDNSHKSKITTDIQKIVLTHRIESPDPNNNYVGIVELEGKKYVIVIGTYKAAICQVKD